MMGIAGGMGGSSLVGEINTPLLYPRSPRSILPPSLPGKLPLFPLEGMSVRVSAYSDRMTLGEVFEGHNENRPARRITGRSTHTQRALTQTPRNRVSIKRPFNGRLTGARGVVRNRWVVPLTPSPAAGGFTDGGSCDR